MNPGADRLEYALEIPEHVRIPQANDLETAGAKRAVTSSVVRALSLVRMAAAVELDDEASSRTVEVDNVTGDRMLSPEPHSELLVAQAAP